MKKFFADAVVAILAAGLVLFGCAAVCAVELVKRCNPWRAKCT